MKTFANKVCKGFDHGLVPQSPVVESRPLPGRVVVAGSLYYHNFNSIINSLEKNGKTIIAYNHYNLMSHCSGCSQLLENLLVQAR